MSTAVRAVMNRPVHPWLMHTTIAYVPGPDTPLLELTVRELLEAFRRHGHGTRSEPDDRTDILLTTARYGEALYWRQALLFLARRRFKLQRMPTLFTLMHITPAQIREALAHFEYALAKDPPDPSDFSFAGMAPQAYQVLLEQGRRGGPLMALLRLVQAQAKCIRILLLVGDERPECLYHLDLAGGHARSDAAEPEAFYEDAMLRMVTAVSTHEVTEHEVVGEPVSRDLWRRLDTPREMCLAGQRLGERGFFTEMVRVADLVQVPAVADAVASQYSEGCFATWDPTLGALVTTVTGSARPVDKGSLSDSDLAVIVGVRPDGRGALVRQIEGHANHAPSSEAVEMMSVDGALPRIALAAWGFPGQGPVARSKLHGHRAIMAYDPRRVEYVPLDAPYYYYPVSCATEAQAQGIQRAFARSEALRNPEDPRQVVFTILPTHGAVMVEKWVMGKAPFQVLWEYMDGAYLVVGNDIPQGPMRYVPGDDGRLVLRHGAQ